MPGSVLIAAQLAAMLAVTFAPQSCAPTQAAAPAQPPSTTQPVPPDSPLTVSMSVVGRFAKGHSWNVKVAAAGKARLEIQTLPKPTIREFTVSEAQRARLRKVLVDEQFLALNDAYGERVPDGSTQTITVAAGNKTKSVTLHFLMNWVQGDREKLREPARAVRVGLVIRDWFDDAQAVDLREYDRNVVAAAPP